MDAKKVISSCQLITHTFPICSNKSIRVSCKNVIIERAELYIGDRFISEVIKPGGPKLTSLNFLGGLPIHCGKLYTEFATVAIITDDNEMPELSWEELSECQDDGVFADPNGYKMRIDYYNGTAHVGVV